MPVCIKKETKSGKTIWRIVECDTGNLVRNKKGTPIDGGGHVTKDKALSQARAINMNI